MRIGARWSREIKLNDMDMTPHHAKLLLIEHYGILHNIPTHVPNMNILLKLVEIFPKNPIYLVG